MAGRIFGLQADLAGGLILATAAALGMVAQNSALTTEAYAALLSVPLGVTLGEAGILKPLLLWINDGLMAIFFLVVGLEVKREIRQGALSTWRKAALPVYAAVGGMAAPALVYLAITGFGGPEARGWAIPAATDIAFAIGVLSLFGARVPPALKVFLLALAVVDDLGAIVIIALFYTADLSLPALAVAGCVLGILLLLNLFGVRRTWPYVVLGLVLWVAVLKSDVHATLAGVALGFLVPLQAGRGGDSLAQRWEGGLHPVSAFLVMPVFAFANAGVDLTGITLAGLAEPVTLAILLGLFFGKQVGVFGTAWTTIRLGLAERPEGAGWGQIYGVSLLAGIGFTMSLFIGSLAFADPALQNQVRLGVLSGSLLSAIAGGIVLSFARSARADEAPAKAPEGHGKDDAQDMVGGDVERAHLQR